MNTFDPTNPATWTDPLPDGYEWREYNATTGEDHLYAPDGTDVTATYWAGKRGGL